MAEKSKSSNKLKARLPRGLADRTPAEIAATREMIEKIRVVYERYGFEPVETPAIEYTDALGKFLPDQDRPNEGVFSFQDDDEQWLSLRYDLTAPLARYVAERVGTENFVLPYRSYRVGWVFRNEKPGPGRFRQFMQFDADTVGSSGPPAGAAKCQYVVKVWTRRLLDGTFDAIQLPEGHQRLIALRAVDKRDRVGTSGVQQLLSSGRLDESGDFTKGAGLSNSANNFVTATSSTAVVAPTFITSEKLLPPELLKDLDRDEEIPFDFAVHRNKFVAYSKGNPLPESFERGIEELNHINSLINAAGYEGRVKISPSVVRGLEYYTGPVFEVDLTFPIKGDDGKSVRFGSVGAGGRYDGLVSRFRGEVVPATGFSIGVSRLAAALQHLGKLDSKPGYGPVVVTVFDKDRLGDYQNMVAKLRAAGIRAELYLGNPKNLGNQLKYADRRNSPCVVIQGSDEKIKGEVTIKDLIVGAELAKLEKGREKHLQKQAQAQETVSENKLVDTVRALLARHGLSK